MLERKEFLYETNEYKIKVPTKSEMKKIYDNISALTEKNNILIDDSEVLFFLFKEIVVPIDDKYDFNKYTLKEFIEITSDNITQYEEMNEIQFYVSKILSNIMTDSYREMLLQIEEARVEIEQSKCNQAVIELQDTMIKTENEENKLKEEDRISTVLKERDFKEQTLPKLGIVEKYRMRRKLLKDLKHEQIQ